MKKSFKLLGLLVLHQLAGVGVREICQSLFELIQPGALRKKSLTRKNSALSK